MRIVRARLVRGASLGRVGSPARRKRASAGTPPLPRPPPASRWRLAEVAAEIAAASSSSASSRRWRRLGCAGGEAFESQASLRRGARARVPARCFRSVSGMGCEGVAVTRKPARRGRTDLLAAEPAPCSLIKLAPGTLPHVRAHVLCWADLLGRFPRVAGVVRSGRSPCAPRRRSGRGSAVVRPSPGMLQLARLPPSPPHPERAKRMDPGGPTRTRSEAGYMGENRTNTTARMDRFGPGPRRGHAPARGWAGAPGATPGCSALVRGARRPVEAVWRGAGPSPAEPPIVALAGLPDALRAMSGLVGAGRDRGLPISCLELLARRGPRDEAWSPGAATTTPGKDGNVEVSTARLAEVTYRGNGRCGIPPWEHPVISRRWQEFQHSWELPFHICSSSGDKGISYNEIVTRWRVSAGNHADPQAREITRGAAIADLAKGVER